MPRILNEMKQARNHAARQLEVLEFQVTSARRLVDELDERLARITKRPSLSALAKHALAEIDDDGLSHDSRSYRYVCRCGKPGTWQPRQPDKHAS